MRTDLFDFDLPADRIALRPVSPRDAARLLVVRPGASAENHPPFAAVPGSSLRLARAQAPAWAQNDKEKQGGRESWVPAFRLRAPRFGGPEPAEAREAGVGRVAGTNGESVALAGTSAEDVFEDRTVRDLPDLLRPGDALVLNDTKVIPARLRGRRIGRGEAEPEIEATLHRRIDGSHWRAFVRPAKRLQAGDTVRFGDEGRVCFLGQLDAQVSQKDEGGEVTLLFSFHGPVLDQAIAERGDMPLPPYIASRRASDERDRADYQTLYARNEGSVAAPTAGLHFTDALLARLQERGIAVHKLTLHVGAGTFLPVKAEDTDGHRMQPEWGTVPGHAAEALNAARAAGGRIVAVGSTALRLIESAADERGRIGAFSGETALFITPGYRFKAVDLMLTNFHLPRSTLFMLVSAFSGLDCMKRAYAYAIEAGYRFYSYGDACLLFPGPRVPDAAQRETVRR